jgi:hypothetical protein
MTEYKLVEISNQQVVRGGPTMPLTPRIEYVTEDAPKVTYTSLSDLQAVLSATESAGQVAFEARGRLLTASHKSVPGAGVTYQLKYTVTADGVMIVARADGARGPVRLILPVIARSDEVVTQPDAKTVRIAKAKGTLAVTCDAAFGAVPAERTFNLVPGFECVALMVELEAGKETLVRMEVA